MDSTAIGPAERCDCAVMADATSWRMVRGLIDVDEWIRLAEVIATEHANHA